MKILFIADPNSIHDVKWIATLSAFATNVFLLPRKIHYSNAALQGITILPPIYDFSIVRFYRTLAEAYQIKKIVRGSKIDLIHILYAEPNALWCFFRDYFNVPMIITTRGTDVLKTIPEAFEKKNLINFFVAPLYKFSFYRADRITVTSEKQKESIRKFSGRTNGIAIVRTGVNVKLIESMRGSSSNLGEQKFILFPRLVKPIYNHEFCLEAIQRLNPMVQRMYAMVFVGKNSGDKAYQEFLEARMHEMPTINFVFLESQSQEELIKLYYHSSLVVMTPKSDGSPVSAMEAMLCGTKVVLGPLEYDSEIFSSVRKISKWDPLELARAMEESLAQVFREVSNSTKQLMDTAYNMDKVREIYRDLIT